MNFMQEKLYLSRKAENYRRKAKNTKIKIMKKHYTNQAQKYQIKANSFMRARLLHRSLIR